MSWTVACYCGTVYQAPPDRCPSCHTPLPDVSGSHPIENDPRPVPARSTPLRSSSFRAA